MADKHNTVELANELTIAWLSNPQTRAGAGDVPAFLSSMHQTVKTLGSGSAQQVGSEVLAHEPAVSVRKSLASPDHIISLIDDKAYKTLKRHLERHGLTPAEYRQRYGLKVDYPMVSAAYSAARSAMAKALGLGRKAGQKAGGAKTAAKKPGRKPGSVAARPAGAKAHADS